MILGLPVALLLRLKQWTGLATALAAGLLIGAGPAGFLAWPLSVSLRTTTWVGNVPTVVDGIPTLAGWLQYLTLLAILGTFGTLGALAGRGVPIGVFDLSDGTSWQPLARALVATLDSQWPTKVRFRDRNGRLTPEPDGLAPNDAAPDSR